MEHPLQLPPEGGGAVQVVGSGQLPQGQRRIAGQLIAGTPQGSLGAIAEALLQAVALGDQPTRCGEGRDHQAAPVS